MNDGERFYQKLWFRFSLFPVVAACFFYDQWWAGLKGLAQFIANLLIYLVLLIVNRGRGAQFSTVLATLNSDVAFIIGWSLAYWMLYRASLFVIAQFILPVNKWEDRKKAAERIRLFARGKHGAAIFVRNGNRIAREAELDSKKPGVALVDLSSAIVLARHDNTKSWYLPDEDEIAASPQKKTREIKLPWRKNKPIPSYYDAKGPGVVFIEKGQKIDAIINLRKQTRTSGEVVVYTRNGIKVKSKVSVVFSLSDEPDVLTVGYVDGTTVNHLKVLKTKESNGDFIVESAHDLEWEDADDILSAIKKPPATNPAPAAGGLYRFDRERVLRAALSQARNKDGEAIQWHEAPLEIATDIFRSVLAEIPYDSLFSGGDLYNRYNLSPNGTNSRSVTTVLGHVKDDFLFKVKLRGLIALQFVQCTGDAHFSSEKINHKTPMPLTQVKKFAPVTFTNERFNHLRDRGIVIKNATFGELQAVESEIQDRMAKNWLAKMENEIAVADAGFELEAIRVHNRSRALLQEEMTHLLAGVFQPTMHSDEALALRVLQALETMVAEMSYEDMQYTDMNELLRNVHDWILMDEAQPTALLPGEAQSGADA
jgi:hypothetical protein